MVKKMPSRDGNELEDPGCLLRQLEDAAPVVRSVRVIILYAHANLSCLVSENTFMMRHRKSNFLPQNSPDYTFSAVQAHVHV